MQMKDKYYNMDDLDNEALIVSESMENMYNIITKRETYSSILKKNDRVLMIFNPLKESPTVDDLIDKLVEYYSGSDIEEYEKCAELLKIKNSDSQSDVDNFALNHIDYDWEY